MTQPQDLQIPVDEDVRSHYRALALEHGDSHVAAQYSSRKSQHARFAVLAEVGDLRGARVLDFGCGAGELAAFFDEVGIECRYTGVDAVDEFLEIARRRFPSHRFGRWNDYAGERFDFIFVSGVFNNKMQDNTAFFRSTVTALFARTEKALAFNLMTDCVDYQDKNIWYTKIGDIVNFLKTVTPYLSVRNDYLLKPGSIPFEYAVYAYRHGRKIYE